MAVDYELYKPPHNPNLVVIQKLPIHVHEVTLRFSKRRVARGRNISGETDHFTYCESCGGWIHAITSEAALDIPAKKGMPGRKGRAYYCPRCGVELDFNGNEVILRER